MGAVVGIDLGTTYSALAHVNEAGLPEIIANDEGDKITPSVVLFDGESAVVGQIAKEALTTEPESVVQLVKRQMGSDWTFMHNGMAFHPEQVSALILKKVTLDGAREIGPIDEAVITVPAYFNDARRNATRIAGEIAGLTVQALIAEPTAAAIAFGLKEQLGEANVVIFDLGGGTFDVTIMNVAGNELNVITTGGDNFLGGANFDKRIYDHFVSQFNDQFHIDLNDPNSIELSDLARVAQEWLKRAERLKRDLSLRDRGATAITACGQTLRVEVTRAEFEAMVGVLVQETEDKLRETLADANVGIEQIDRVLLVGGSTRMPMIREQVSRIFGKAPDTGINPDEAVALGAALYAANRALKSGKTIVMPQSRADLIEEFNVTDVAAHSIGVQAYDRLPEQGGTLHNAILLNKNTSLPFTGTREFFTSGTGQTSITVEVLEGDERDLQFCQNIATLHIDGLPSGRAAGMPVDVTMRYNENGILEVSAADRASNREARSTINRVAGISEADRAQATAAVSGLTVA